MMAMNGFLNVLKPPAMSSHDVISCLRRIYRIKRIGHAGTLDPAAAGVLPVAVGSATRLVEYMSSCDKFYRAQVLLGKNTDTGDYTGEVVVKQNFTMPTKEQIESALQKFCGTIEQIPPVYSAIKINGAKACDLARKNIDVQLAARKVEIYSLQLVDLLPDGFLIDVHCSKGTYIRSLCSDIGKALQIPATMGLLVRTAVGAFKLTEASTLEEIGKMPKDYLQDFTFLSGLMAHCDVSDALLTAFCHGQKIDYISDYTDDTSILVYSGDTFVGVGKICDAGTMIMPHKVFINIDNLN